MFLSCFYHVLSCSTFDRDLSKPQPQKPQSQFVLSGNDLPTRSSAIFVALLPGCSWQRPPEKWYGSPDDLTDRSQKRLIGKAHQPHEVGGHEGPNASTFQCLCKQPCDLRSSQQLRGCAPKQHVVQCMHEPLKRGEGVHTLDIGLLGLSEGSQAGSFKPSCANGFNPDEIPQATKLAQQDCQAEGS